MLSNPVPKISAFAKQTVCDDLCFGVDYFWKFADIKWIIAI